MNLSAEQKVKIAKHKKQLTGEFKAPVDMAGSLFPKGFISFLASPPGVGKTWITLFYAVMGSVGKTMTGEEIKPLKTTILAGEAGTELLNQRLASTTWEFNPDMISMYSAVELSLDNIPLYLNEEMGRQYLLEIIQQDRPDVLFFDTLIAFHSLDESKQQDMAKIYMYLARIANYFNIAIVCNHHTRKRPSNNPTKILTQDDLIGSSAGIRIAHSVYIVDNDEDHQNGFVITNVKSWEKKVPPISLEFIEDDYGRVTFGVKQTAKDNRSVAKQILNSIICYGYKGTLFRPLDMAVKYGVLEATIRKYLTTYCEPDEHGLQVLKKITIDNEVLFAGNLPPKVLMDWTANHGYPIPKHNNRSGLYSPDDFLDFEA